MNIPRGTYSHLFESSKEIYSLRRDKRPTHVEQDAIDRWEALPQDSPLVRSEPTRISLLIRNAFSAVSPDNRQVKFFEEPSFEDTLDYMLRDGDSESDYRSVLLPSPLTIVFNFLVIPDVPATRAYALVALRNYLFSKIGVTPKAIKNMPLALEELTVPKLEGAYEHIETYMREEMASSRHGRDNIPGKGTTKTDQFLRSFLFMKGILVPRFGTGKDRPQVDPLKARLEYCDRGEVLNADLFEFKLHPDAGGLPEFGELVNEIWGLPLPIRGADTMFQGGLRFPSRGGLVMAVHGGPGTGKTSFALTIGAALAGLDVSTLYFTLEESAEDLRARIPSLLPKRMRRLGFLRSQGNWLRVGDPPGAERSQIDLAKSVLDNLKAVDRALRSDRSEEAQSDINSVVKACRLVVVLDGLHELFMKQHVGNHTPDVQTFADLIYACRELEALVIVTTGDRWFGEASLDYLVDVAVHFRHEGLDSLMEKPGRMATLVKARHQLCRPGTYTMHLSGENGFRLSPQISMQIDRRAVWKFQLPDRGLSKETLNLYTWKSHLEKIQPYLGGSISPFEVNLKGGIIKIYSGSHILIHGQGSGGKAALGLKLALAPMLRESPDASCGLEIGRSERVLVISFLYPEQYYQNLQRALTRLARVEYRRLVAKGVKSKRNEQAGRDSDTITGSFYGRMTVLALYPGFLLPNDLFNKIERTLDEAELIGDPYRSILIDGIHNVFLQFPKIEQFGLIWPMLFNGIRRRGTTLITTSTTLVVPGETTRDTVVMVDDNRSGPLRHALVQEVDFYLGVNAVDSDGDAMDHKEGSIEFGGQSGTGSQRQQRSLFELAARREPSFFSIKVMSAIGQPIPRKQLLWSREKLVLVER